MLTEVGDWYYSMGGAVALVSPKDDLPLDGLPVHSVTSCGFFTAAKEGSSASTTS